MIHRIHVRAHGRLLEEVWQEPRVAQDAGR